jgi:hypothetical protein
MVKQKNESDNLKDEVSLIQGECDKVGSLGDEFKNKINKKETDRGTLKIDIMNL